MLTKHMGPENQGYVPAEAEKPLTVAETEAEKKWFAEGDKGKQKPPQTETNNDEKVIEEKWFKDEKDEAA